jgi:tetratricopeptide (TPR) repeat protein
MRILASVLCGLSLSLLTTAQQHAAHAHDHPVVLVSGLSDLHHPVSTRNPEAQKFFDQGLRFIYAFNHEEAARSFRHAGELDPHLAMAYWGVAEAVGPNYNDPADPARYKEAHEAIQKAVELSSDSSPAEQAYIQAMARRFPADPNSDLKQAAEDYRDAMRGVVRQFPDDLDAATLFAEAGMNLHPWTLWRPDGTPEAGTEEIVATLESVLKRDPNHLGAVHYYIHSVEASSNPARALSFATKLPALAPAAGHLVHMPAHIYIRTGDYQAAVQTNEKAAEADRAYIRANGAEGVYPLMYYSHNLHFIAVSGAMDGSYLTARKNAELLHANVAPHVKEMPPLEAFMTVPLSVELRFHHWAEILRTPEPDASLKLYGTFWHFARGQALAATGKTKDADAEYKTVSNAVAALPPDLPFGTLNSAQNVLKVAVNLLGARVALAQNDKPGAIALLQSAVAAQDALGYDEPPDWFYPVRESMGALLLMTGDAAGAEKVFRDDLDRNPRNPRSLWGLRQSLLKQKRNYDAGFIQKQFEAAWSKGAPALKLDDLI